MIINGQTQVLGLIGENIRFSKSFAMHNAAFTHLGINLTYIPLPVTSRLLQSAIEGIKAFQILGVNVTMPFKEKILSFLDAATETASAVGAVNTVVQREGKLVGENTDGAGFVNALQEANISTQNRPVFMYGAGGAAKAIAYALALQGVREFYISNRTPTPILRISDMLNQRFSAVSVQQFSNDVSDNALIINCTPVGSVYQRAPAMLWPEKRSFTTEQTVVDIVYSPKETVLLKKAKADGAQTLGGLPMLLHQAARSFTFWTGQEAPVSIMEKSMGEFNE